MRSTRASTRRDLPMPGSPSTSTTWPSPSRAVSQARSSRPSSSWRPTSGCAPAARAARPAASPRSPVTRQAGTGSSMPLRDWPPRSSQSKRSPSSARVPAPITTWSAAATDCSRAARLGVSPTTALSADAPSPTMSPTTTRPVAMPTRTARCTPRDAPVSALSAPIDATMSSPDRTARSASSSWARGKPK